METTISKDAAIIVKNITHENGTPGIELGLVFTRKQDDESEDSEAEAFARFAFPAIAKLYEQITAPPEVTTSLPPRPEAMRMGASHPGKNFTPPTIMRGEEGDLKR